MDNRDTIRAKLLKKAKDAINQKLAGREIHIIKAVNLLGDLDSVENLLKENASEWKLRKPAGDAQNAYLQLEKNAESIDAEKKELTEFIEKEMAAEFPNFSILATPIIGAKLLASAGSKKRLCFMPASTIQVLGAEKALFAHIRRDAKSPKHGHLFNHPLMQKLPRFKRGKAARIIAGKLAIALKQDYFEGEDTSKETLKEMEKRIAEISAAPVTAKQQEREKELIAQHDGSLPTDAAEGKRFSKPKEESRTWTPEERKAYFAKQNEGKEFVQTPKDKTAEKSQTRNAPSDYAPRENSFRARRRESGFPSTHPYRTGGVGRAGGERSYAPRREGNFGGERGYAPRRESSYGSDRSYPRRSFAPRREGNFSAERSYAPRRESGYPDRASGEGRSYPTRGSYSPRGTSGAPRREGGFGERKSFAPRREYKSGEDRGGTFGARENFGERKPYGGRKKFIKPSRNRE